MKKLLPKFLGIEHLILEAIDSARRKEKEAVTVKNIILILNDPKMLELTGNRKEVSGGSVFGTLSRLKGKGLLAKVLTIDNGNEELGYKITGHGSEVLNGIRHVAEKALDGLPEFMPGI
jgi:hypothetical protein